MLNKAIIGKKVGMTQIFNADGKVIPCTVIEAGPCVVTQLKTEEKDGYNAVQFGFEDVKEALLAADIEWFSYYDVRGEGKMRQDRIYRGVMYDTSSIERVLLNVVVRNKNVEKTIHAIQEAARTGEIGDGRIFVIPVEDTVRIRTGERGDIALYNAEQEK